jgi:hypothetical protein
LENFIIFQDFININEVYGLVGERDATYVGRGSFVGFGWDGWVANFGFDYVKSSKEILRKAITIMFL